MLLEENFQLLAKTFLPVMLLLRLDIMNRIFHARHADAECAKTFLPREALWPEFGKCFPQPFRGIAFQQLHRLGNGKRRGQTQQQMHMVANATDGERLHVILPRDAAEIWPEPFADGGREPRTTLRGGEHTMHQAGVEGVHGDFKIICPPTIAQHFSAGNNATQITKSRQGRQTISFVPDGTYDDFKP